MYLVDQTTETRTARLPEIITALRTDEKGNGMGQATGTLRERLRNSVREGGKRQLAITPRNAQNPVSAAVLVESLDSCC